jgi:hypothetical protein
MWGRRQLNPPAGTPAEAGSIVMSEAGCRATRQGGHHPVPTTEPGWRQRVSPIEGTRCAPDPAWKRRICKFVRDRHVKKPGHDEPIATQLAEWDIAEQRIEASRGCVAFLILHDRNISAACDTSISRNPAHPRKPRHQIASHNSDEQRIISDSSQI